MPPCQLAGNPDLRKGRLCTRCSPVDNSSRGWPCLSPCLAKGGWLTSRRIAESLRVFTSRGRIAWDFVEIEQTLKPKQLACNASMNVWMLAWTPNAVFPTLCAYDTRAHSCEGLSISRHSALGDVPEVIPPKSRSFRHIRRTS